MIYVFNLMFLLLHSLLEDRLAVCVYLSGDNGIITDYSEGQKNRSPTESDFPLLVLTAFCCFKSIKLS